LKILLVEPNYRNKYPPLGLMKISTYHKMLGDEVYFIKGNIEKFALEKWDRIYISTLFTFYFNITVNTVKYFLNSVNNQNEIFIGGPMATIMKNDLIQALGNAEVNIIEGLLNKTGILGFNEINIDELIPDYTIIDPSQNENLKYNYPVSDSYYLHITHGCIRKCVFCAVPIIEPEFIDCTSFDYKIHQIDLKYGEKRHLKVMDNNILASNQLEFIVSELVKLGFGKQNKSYIINGKKYTRYVDFNQGLDARLLYKDPSIMERLNLLEIRPMRIAFDHANEEFIRIYSTVMRQAASLNIRTLSNYVLFNLDDTPKELYDRLKINIELNHEFSIMNKATTIWSFPMKFSPIFGEHSFDRKYIGKYWNKKSLRGLQCILIPTHGIVGPKGDYFTHAFGEDYQEFEKILLYPENYIINRERSKLQGKIEEWELAYSKLSKVERDSLKTILSINNKRSLRSLVKDNLLENNLLEILGFYLD